MLIAWKEEEMNQIKFVRKEKIDFYWMIWIKCKDIKKKYN